MTVTTTSVTDEVSTTNPVYSIAHLGNSIQYYNDCPRLLETMLLSTALGRVVDLDVPQRNTLVREDSCLRGGATIPSLWEKGNGMRTKFASRPESILPGDNGEYDIGAPTLQDLLGSVSPSGNSNRYWDFVVINDHTQSPVRTDRKEASKAALETTYLPAIADAMEASKENDNGNGASTTTTTTVVFVQTMAYKSPVKDSGDLGSFDDFTNALIAGYDEYVGLVEAFDAKRFPKNPTNHQEEQQQQRQQRRRLSIKAAVAPLGRAYQVIRNEHFDLWSTAMYANDFFHPSPHGTLLQACILHCIITGGQKFSFFDNDEANDNANGNDSMEAWWKRARYLQPTTYPNGEPQKPLRFPTRAEAILLNDIAYRVYLERAGTKGGGTSRL